jgi:hypothetical protein
MDTTVSEKTASGASECDLLEPQPLVSIIVTTRNENLFGGS